MGSWEAQSNHRLPQIPGAPRHREKMMWKRLIAGGVVLICLRVVTKAFAIWAWNDAGEMIFHERTH